MRNAFIAILMSLIPFGSVAQDNTLQSDGRMWATWSNSGSESLFVKAAYVQGVIEGFKVGATLGYYSGRLDEKNDALDYVVRCRDKGPCAGIPLGNMIKPKSNMDDFGPGVNKVRERYASQNASVLDIVH